jgi:hypothetical protein
MSAKKRCFVISPIGAPGSEVRAHADDVFDYIIKPVTTQLGYETERGDHVARPGRISDQMYDRILHDDLLVAVLTFQNPNVYYELAIAHAAARPLIILCESSHALPFDIKDQRVIFYDLRPRSLHDHTYRRELANAIAQVEASGEPEVPFRPNLTPLGGLGESFRVFERFTDTVSAGALPLKLIRETERSLCLSGISLLTLSEFPDVRPALQEISERGAEIKVLIMHERNPALGSMLNADLNKHVQKVRGEIKRSFEMWSELRRKMPRLTVRKLRQGILYQQVFMSERRMIYTPYSMGVTTYYSATVQTDQRSPLFAAQKREFDFLWQQSAERRPQTSKRSPTSTSKRRARAYAQRPR